MPRPLRVFLCHASQDKPVVWKLHRYLKQHGIKPWLDQEDLLPGEDWEVEIPKALFASDVILVCLSKNSVNKEGFVQKEITFALDKAMEKPEGTIFIIPVKLEECEIPRRLTRYQWVDLSRAEGRKRLLMGLNKRATELGSDVSPVILDDTRRISTPRTPKPEIKKPEEKIFSALVKEEIEIKEEPKKGISASALEVEEPEVKFTQKKPFTKLLNPSSLYSNGTSSPQSKEKSGLLSDESVEKILREQPLQTEQEVSKKSVHEKREWKIREWIKKELRTGKWREFTDKIFSYISSNSRRFAIGGLIFIAVLFIIFGGNYIAKDVPSVTKPPIVMSSVTLQSPTLTATSAATPQPPTPTKTKIMSTSTVTLVPPTLTISPIPLPIGSTMVSDKDGMVMVYVPAGEFTMGSDDDSAVSNPEHQVYLDAYWIDQTEVTNAMFATFLNEKGNQSVFRAEWLDALDSEVISQDGGQWIVKDGYKNRPVVQVTWYGAFAYCSWAGRKLPTEAQWEKAARGIDARIYPWGNETPKVNLLNFDSNIGDTNKVGSYWQGVGPYGAYDMSGNVWEWVNDWFETYDNLYSSNPSGPISGSSRVLRGGSYYDSEDLVRSYVRESSGPEFSQDYWGFRCAHSP